MIHISLSICIHRRLEETVEDCHAEPVLSEVEVLAMTSSFYLCVICDLERVKRVGVMKKMDCCAGLFRIDLANCFAPSR